jgi:hypothetical protein
MSMVLEILGCQGDKIKWGVGVWPQKANTKPPSLVWQHMEMQGGEHGRSVLGGYST